MVRSGSKAKGEKSSRGDGNVARRLTVSKDVESLFRSLDENGDGLLSVAELTQACERYDMASCSAALSELRKVCENVDSIGLETFEIIVQSYESAARLEFERQKRIAMARKNVIDGDRVTHDSYFDREDVKEIFAEKFENDPDELDQFVDLVFERIDMNNDEKISFAEFVLWAVMRRTADLEIVYEDFRANIDLGEDTVPPAKTLSTSQQVGFLSAGAIAGVFSRTVTAPIERLKVLMQVARTSGGGLSHDVSRLLRVEGVLSLWRGNFANCLKVAPSKAVKFASYEQVKLMVCRDPSKPSIAENFFSAGFVSAATGLAVFPLDTLKTRLSIQTERVTMTSCAKDLYATRGLRGFYAGAMPSLLSTVPFSGINMAAFMHGKQVWKGTFGYSDIEPLPPHVCVLLSVFSTLSAQIVAYPLYCVKTNLQAGGEVSTRGFVPEIRHIMSKRGIRGLYAGLSMNFLKALPAVAVTFTVYEQAKAFLGV